MEASGFPPPAPGGDNRRLLADLRRAPGVAVFSPLPSLENYIKILSFMGTLELSFQNVRVLFTICVDKINIVVTNQGGFPLYGQSLNVPTNTGPQALPYITNLNFDTTIVLVRSLIFAGYRQVPSVFIPAQAIPPSPAPGQKLGEGTFGKVYAFEYKGQRLVEKSIQLFELNTSIIASDFIRELGIGFRVRSPFLSRLLDFHLHLYTDETKTALKAIPTASLFYSAADMDLQRALHVDKIIQPNERTVLIYQLIHATAELHKIGVRHRDFKPANTLLYLLKTPQQAGAHYLRFRCAVTDYGISTINECAAAQGEYTNDVYTLWYRAPEVLLRPVSRYGDSADIWALGTLCAEIYFGKPIFYGKDNVEVLQKIILALGPPSATSWPEGLGLVRQYYPDVLDASGSLVGAPAGLAPLSSTWDRSDPMVRLLMSMLDYDPAKRPTAKDALESPLFTGVRGGLERVLSETPFIIQSGAVAGAAVDPLEYFATERVPLTPCIDRLLIWEAPIGSEVKVSEGDYRMTISYMYGNYIHIILPRAYFLACHIYARVVESYDPKIRGIPIVTLINAILMIAALVNTPGRLYQLAINSDLFRVLQVEILGLLNWNPFWSTEYDFFQSMRANYSERAASIAQALLVYTTQSHLYNRYSSLDIALECLRIAEYIDKVLLAPTAQITFDPVGRDILSILKTGSVFNSLLVDQTGLGGPELELALTSNYWNRRPPQAPAMSPIGDRPTVTMGSLVKGL